VSESPYPEFLPAEAPPRRRTLVVRVGRIGWKGPLALLAVLLVVGLAAMGTGYRYRAVPADGEIALPDVEIPSDPAGLAKLARRTEARQKQLLTKLGAKAPKGVWVVVDQTHNRLYINRDDSTLREAICSAGSGMILKEVGGKGRRWVFDTPRGVYKVNNIVKNPIWKKPDWAFVEEGKPIPKNPQDRFEAGTLGEYAFYLQDGYMIHGTLYTRLLGRNVTHGCIRLGRDDLRALKDVAGIGTPVYIF